MKTSKQFILCAGFQFECLSTLEIGAFHLLYNFAFNNKNKLPSVDWQLQRIAKLDKNQWDIVKKGVLESFVFDNDCYHHPEISVIFAKKKHNLAKKIKAGIASGIARNSQKIHKSDKLKQDNDNFFEAEKNLSNGVVFRRKILTKSDKSNIGLQNNDLDEQPKVIYEAKEHPVEVVDASVSCQFVDTEDSSVEDLLEPLTNDATTHSPGLTPGIVCKLLKSCGVSSVNPSHILLSELIERGADQKMFKDSVDVSKSRGHLKFAYVLKIVETMIIESERETRNALIPPEGFDSFWDAYPRKEGKSNAIIAFRLALKEIDMPKLLENINDRKLSKAWKDPQYIPFAANYLKDKRWLDVISTSNTGLTVSDLPLEQQTYRPAPSGMSYLKKKMLQLNIDPATFIQ